MSDHTVVGKMGEDLAAMWLERKGHRLLGRNYAKKWGEIDIISRETSKVHFLEVKAVSYETKDELIYSVSHETWRPEEKVHTRKLQRLGRAIESWLMEYGYTGNWQIDVLTVRMVPREKYAQIGCIENVILE